MWLTVCMALALTCSACCHPKTIVQTVIQKTPVPCVTEAWPDLVPVSPFYTCIFDGKEIVCACGGPLPGARCLPREAFIAYMPDKPRWVYALPPDFSTYVLNDNRLFVWALSTAKNCGTQTPQPATAPSTQP